MFKILHIYLANQRPQNTLPFVGVDVREIAEVGVVVGVDI